MSAPATSTSALRKRTAFATPRLGDAVRLRWGRWEMVLEGVRGGHALLWSNGREARRFALGLGDCRELHLVLEPPAHACWIKWHETLVLAPHGRMHGYVLLPLVPTLYGVTPDDSVSQLLELDLGELHAEWSEGSGVLLSCTSPWCVRFPMTGGEPKAVVPLFLCNPSAERVMPGQCQLQVSREALVECRGTLVVRPMRLVWEGGTWRA